MKDSIRVVALVDKEMYIQEIYERRLTPKGNIPKDVIRFILSHRPLSNVLLHINFVNFNKEVTNEG